MVSKMYIFQNMRVPKISSKIHGVSQVKMTKRHPKKISYGEEPPNICFMFCEGQFLAMVFLYRFWSWHSWFLGSFNPQCSYSWSGIFSPENIKLSDMFWWTFAKILYFNISKKSSHVPWPLSSYQAICCGKFWPGLLWWSSTWLYEDRSILHTLHAQFNELLGLLSSISIYNIHVNCEIHLPARKTSSSRPTAKEYIYN